MDFQKVINETMTRRGLSEAELAAMVGCAQSTINRLRTGEIKVPSYGLGAKLVKMWERK